MRNEEDEEEEEKDGEEEEEDDDDDDGGDDDGVTDATMLHRCHDDDAASFSSLSEVDSSSSINPGASTSCAPSSSRWTQPTPSS